jgi:hypothetical protein
MHIIKIDPRVLNENPDDIRRSKSTPQADALLLATVKAVGIIQPPVVSAKVDPTDGATITTQPGGWTSYTNAHGVTNMISPTGQQSGYFGGLLSREEDEDAESESEGGLFSGW